MELAYVSRLRTADVGSLGIPTASSLRLALPLLILLQVTDDEALRMLLSKAQIIDELESTLPRQGPASFNACSRTGNILLYSVPCEHIPARRPPTHQFPTPLTQAVVYMPHLQI